MSAGIDSVSSASDCSLALGSTGSGSAERCGISAAAVSSVDSPASSLDAPSFDSSSTATNLLSDSSYTYYRRIGSILTDSSSNITQFVQMGDTFYWDNPALSVDTSTGTIGNTYTLDVPPDVRVMANVNVYTENATAYTGIYMRPTDVDNEAASETAAPLATVQNSIANEGQFANTQILTNTSKQIYVVAEANSTTLRIATLGWRDFRGTN